MTAIVDFLTKITLHSQEAKDSFFRYDPSTVYLNQLFLSLPISSLPIQLHSLSPTLLAEHVVPLLCTALVMAEPKSSLIWPHLLCPTSKTNPRQKVFDESKICPLLSEELFRLILFCFPLFALLHSCSQCSHSTIIVGPIGDQRLACETGTARASRVICLPLLLRRYQRILAPRSTQ